MPDGGKRSDETLQGRKICPYCGKKLKFVEKVDEKIDRYFCSHCDAPVYHHRITGAFYNYIPFHQL